MDRRRCLSALAGASLLAFGRKATAQSAPVDARSPRVKAIDHDRRGTTFSLALDNAPFPAQGCGYRDNTVIVFVPSHFRFRAPEGVGVLFHLHGHSTTADRVLVSHALREQLADSEQNALLVVPQLAVLAADSSCGKLESPGALARLLVEAVATTARAGRGILGDSALPEDAPVGTVCLSAHSGGFHAAASCLRTGGVDVRETYLFDALYAETDAFRDWVVARRGQPLHRRHKLVSYFVAGGKTEVEDDLLRAELERLGMLCAYERQEGELSRHDLSHADAVFVRTGLWHSNVTWETNALRDCLFASALPRHLPTTWFARKAGARPLDTRPR